MTKYDPHHHVKCLICNKPFRQITTKHLTKHNLSLSQYKELHPTAPIMSPDCIQKHSLAAKNKNASRINIPRSDAVKQKIKQTKKNNPRSAWNKGVPRTEQQKKYLSEVAKAKYASGERTHWNLGKQHKQETKQKIKETALSQNRKIPQHVKQKKLQTMQHNRANGIMHGNTKRFFNKLNDDSTQKFFDREWWYQEHIVNKRTLASLSVELGLHWCNSLKTIKKQLDYFGIEQQYWSPTSSSQQKDLEFFLQELGINFITRDRKLIKPFELDIIIPDKKIAIEYCGLYWHSSEYKPNNYHYNKLKMCNNQGYRLITIFEDEWLNLTDVVKEKLSYILNKSTRKKINARSTRIEIINKNERDVFLNKYHIQQKSSGTISYGLYDREELVSVIVFIQQKNNQWLLSRYASKYIVRGGYSKLLNYFMKNNEWNKIITFCDLRWDSGETYKKMGFVHEATIPYDYSYVISGNRVHKFNYRHKNLPKLLEKYDSTKSEVENTLANGIYRIFDCGKNRFVIKK